MFFHYNSRSYIAVIGDVKRSRELEDRSKVQCQLRAILDKINEQYANDIVAKFVITLGDEFQGLLVSDAHVMEIISVLQSRMHPVEIRFGIGFGSITTDIDPEMAIGADGPAYYRARESVEYLKEKEKRKQTYTGDIRFEMNEANGTAAMMLNTIADLMYAIRSSWSERQREVIYSMLEQQESQSDVAKRLNIKQPTVQKILVAGKFYAYKDALDTSIQVLKEIGGKCV